MWWGAEATLGELGAFIFKVYLLGPLWEDQAQGRAAEPSFSGIPSGTGSGAVQRGVTMDPLPTALAHPGFRAGSTGGPVPFTSQA